jgi:hypothetical protein
LHRCPFQDNVETLLVLFPAMQNTFAGVEKLIVAGAPKFGKSELNSAIPL